MIINKDDLIQRTSNTEYIVGKYYKTNDTIADKGFVFRCEGTGGMISLNLVKVEYAN
jgi:hypothetical protein